MYKNIRNLSYFIPTIKPYWQQLFLLFMLSQSSALLGLINPYLTKLIIDNFTTNNNIRVFISLSVLGALFFVINMIITNLYDYLTHKLNQIITFQLTKQVAQKLIFMKLIDFRNKAKNELLFKFNYDIEKLVNILSTSLLTFAKIITTILFTFIIIWHLSWQLALLSLFSGIFMFLPMQYYTKKRWNLLLANIKSKELIFKHLTNVLNFSYFIKAARKEEAESRTFIQKLFNQLHSALKVKKVQIFSVSITEFISRGIVGTMLLYGGFQIIQGHLTLGTLTAITVYLTKISSLHAQLAQLFQNTNLGLISGERVKEILEDQPQIVREQQNTPLHLKPFKAHIKISNLSFEFFPDQKIIDNLTLEIPPKQWLGIFGPSGCGKSTLINLILGLYQPKKGEILINDQPVSYYDHPMYQNKIVLAAQDVYIWNDTIKNNLLYLNPNANEKHIDHVLKQVSLKDLVASKPDQLNAIIGDDGCKLSNGQKQRLSLARSLLANPELLILDEALSFIDNPTIEHILTNIKTDYPDLTLILISHNPLVKKYIDSEINFMPT